MRNYFYYCLLILCAAPVLKLNAQGNATEAVIIYNRNISQPLGGGVIPFDKRFTMIVPQFNGENIRDVFAYTSVYNNGNRQLVHSRRGLIHDLDLEFAAFNDTLAIYFPALKPNSGFELAVTRSISGANLKTLFKLNEAIKSNNQPEATSWFRKIMNDAVESAGSENVSFFRYPTLQLYINFYNSKLAVHYDKLHDENLYSFAAFPTIFQIQHIQQKFTAQSVGFRDLNRMSRLIEDDSVRNIFLGTQTMKYAGKVSNTSAVNYTERIKNLTASLLYFDTLSNYVNASIAIEGDAYLTVDYRMINNIIESLNANKMLLETTFKKVSDAISDDDEMAETELLVGTTEFKDIKTAGGNLITFDLGLANIGVTDISNNFVYMPKPYYGINIYFRPIDRNTRKRDFPKKYKVNPGEGPLRELQSVRDIRQRLSLCIGLTFTSMSNKQFDYVLNSSALLIGPGYRLGRFWKINAGLSLLKRTDKNPLISDKKVVAGEFISLSADIDLVQGIKDFTNLIFK